MFADYHVHTEYSDDSVYPMESVVIDAISMGMQEICFTDHVDYGIKRDWGDPRGILYRRGGPGIPGSVLLANVDYPNYVRQIGELQQKYGKEITIRLGMEFGIQKHRIQQYRELYSRYSYDFIILSIHQSEDKEFWTQDYQQGRTQQEYNEGYYKEMLSVVRNYHDYSVLGHMDLINRYDKAGLYPFEKVRPMIIEILKTVIAEEKGIEINTSSHRYGLTDLMPSREILRLYRELGGKIITIGSDSHKPEHLGTFIEESKEELRKIGFTQFCTYEKMVPIFYSL